MTQSHSSSQPMIKVWDPLVRIFHWSLVGFFAFSYFTGEDGHQLHQWSGYGIAGLITFRLIWGVIGTKYARFTDFVKSPSSIKAYLIDLNNGQCRRHLGHNPAGGLMIILLLAGLAFMAFTGMLLAGFDGNGPLAGSPLLILDFLPIEDFHELTANLLVIAIVLHVAGVILSSLLHRENLVKSMITGTKMREE